MIAIDPAMLVNWPLEEIWSSAAGFVGFMIVAVGMIGLISRSLSIPAMGAYLTFSYYASVGSIDVLTPISYVTHTLIVIGVAFKLWRTEAVGDNI